MGLGRANVQKEILIVEQLLSSDFIVFDYKDVAYYKNCVLYISYKMGAAESGNNIEIKIEFSPDAIYAFQEIQQTIVSGIDTISLQTHKFTAVSPAETYDRFILPFEISGVKWMRLSVKENGVVANYGTVSIIANVNWET